MIVIKSASVLLNLNEKSRGLQYKSDKWEEGVGGGGVRGRGELGGAIVLPFRG